MGACQKGWSRDPRLMPLLLLWFLGASHSFTFRVEHVAGRDNSTADTLSRLQLERFRALQPTARPTPTRAPAAIREFLASPTDDCRAATGYAI